jgi:hypothetical protein
MAAAATSPHPWQPVFGNTEEWAPPECSPLDNPAAAETALTWRLIFGNTSAWLPAQLGSPETPAGSALAELCEFCRLPIRQGDDFIANSAGERPIHTKCLNLESPPAPVHRPGGWLSMLLGLVKS